jgi:hypothetical protein
LALSPTVVEESAVLTELTVTEVETAVLTSCPPLSLRAALTLTELAGHAGYDVAPPVPLDVPPIGNPPMPALFGAPPLNVPPVVEFPALAPP